MLKRNRQPLNAPHASSEAVPRLARIIPRDAHPISRSRISPDALRVLYRLKDAGFQAFLVGGCVRDLIIGESPKDFDVVTDALPEQVRRLFRNCRLVGRRFRLAHVIYGREIIEVATFRASGVIALDAAEEDSAEDEDDVIDAIDGDDDDEIDDLDDDDSEPDAGIADADDAVVATPAPLAGGAGRSLAADAPGAVDRVVDQHGRILRDNVYGSIDEDVWRRDFTANSLYYNIADFSIWDYVGGFEDTKERRLRLIGDPETRYREDPVRMLRAARFEAKLGFTIDPPSAEPIATLCDLLAGVPPARLFDETLKLFLSGHGVRSFDVLQGRGLLDALLPAVAQFAARYPDSPPQRMLRKALENTDRRVQEGRSVTPAFLFCVLVYGPVGLQIESAPAERWQDIGTILDATDTVLRSLVQRVAVPRRFTLGVREMLALQPRLESPKGRRAMRALEHPRFRAAFDLLELRAQFGMASPDTVRWWSDVQKDPDVQRRLSIAEDRPQGSDGRAEQGGDAAGGAGAARQGRRRRGGRKRGGSRPAGA